MKKHMLNESWESTLRFNQCLSTAPYFVRSILRFRTDEVFCTRIKLIIVSTRAHFRRRTVP